MSSEVFRLPRFNCVNVAYKERSYQLRIQQLTTKNISKIFNLIPDTVVLVSTDGSVSLPDNRGKFSDVDKVTDHEWVVQGAETSKRSSVGGAGYSSPTRASTSKWKPSIFARNSNSATAGSNSRTSETPLDVSWQKSIEVRSIIGDAIVSTAEHPLTLTATTANVSNVCNRISQEAFSGASVRLLNAKNLPIFDVDGTKGSKFWKSPKIIKAVKEEEYRKLECKRNSSYQQASCSSKHAIRVDCSTSDSDGGFRPLVRKKRYNIQDMGIGGRIFGEVSVVRDKCNEIEIMMMSVKNAMGSLQPAKRFKPDVSIREMFTCIICKDSPMEHDPVVTQCCSGVVACKRCLQEWIAESSTCPQCREQISIDICFNSAFPAIVCHNGSKQHR